jgi:hypothetical protein
MAWRRITTKVIELVRENTDLLITTFSDSNLIKIEFVPHQEFQWSFITEIRE